MSTLTLFLVSSLFACGEKSGTTAAPAAAAAAKLTMDLPDDAASRGFAETLIGGATADFAPTDADGAAFEYTMLKFRGDGSWHAEGYVEAMDERMECTESGTWTMNAADSKTVATVAWTVNDTTCVGRDKGTETRAQLTISKSGIESAMFR
jgi:hypothetical protein